MTEPVNVTAAASGSLTPAEGPAKSSFEGNLTISAPPGFFTGRGNDSSSRLAEIDAEKKIEQEIEQKKLLVEVWKNAVATQMHFNEMSVKARQLGLTFVVAALGLAAVLLTRADGTQIVSIEIHSIRYSTHVSGIIALMCVLAIYGVKILDLEVYHKMLRGSVAFGEDLEAKMSPNVLPTEKGLVQAVSFFSRNIDAKFDGTAKVNQYTTSNTTSERRKSLPFEYALKSLFSPPKTAYQKVTRFYRVIIFFPCSTRLWFDLWFLERRKN